MNELKIFENAEFGEIRTVAVDGTPWFVASDICKALEIANTTQAIQRLDEDERSMFNIGRQGEAHIVNESGLYTLVLASRKKEAKEFKRWITHEVLPSIRKHGAYMTEQTLEKALTSPDFLIQLATNLKAEQEKNRLLTEENEKMKPSQIFASAVSASDSSMLVRDVAKMIRQNGVPLGEKRFYKWLREKGYVCQNSTRPTQKAMELGLFEVVIRTIEKGNGLPMETVTTRITGKGQVYFINKFLNVEKP